MFDKYNRQINYLRISVTDRCNLRCTYCMPEEGVPSIAHQEILSYNEIVEVTKIAVEMGITKVRLTGGEPLVRKGIVNLVEMLAKINGIKDFSMTTNGQLLDLYADRLVNAGLQRINISLDSVDPLRYKMITRRGDLEQLFKGIQAAQKAKLFPIKINCVIKNSIEEPDAVGVAKFCEQNNLQIRYIREMDLEKGLFWRVKGGDGGECKICNRLRLTANGKIKPCLFSNDEFDIRNLGAENAIRQAIENKPLCGTMNNNNHFNNIGG